MKDLQCVGVSVLSQDLTVGLPFVIVKGPVAVALLFSTKNIHFPTYSHQPLVQMLTHLCAARFLRIYRFTLKFDMLSLLACIYAQAAYWPI